MEARAIRSLRRRRGWTQAELAERLGSDPVTVSRWERGVSSPRPSALLRLRELTTPVPTEVSSLVRIVGGDEAERRLRGVVLLEWTPPRHRFATTPARRIGEVERALRDQSALRAAARLVP
jgi:transcriptional regulator with XRE-family HTH domain